MTTGETSITRTWHLSPDLLGFVNRDGVFFETNPAWKVVLGWSEEEIRSKTFADFIHPDDLARTVAKFADMKQGGSALHFENRYVCKDGSYLWFSWVAVEEGDAFFCSARDVTSDKERRRSLKSHEDEALLREQFVAILGHDLRNPLAAIGSATRIAAREDHNERTAAMYDAIESSADRMARLIDVTMDFARARLGGGIPVDLASTADLAQDFAQVLDEIRLGHPDSAIDFTSNIDARVVCDVARLKQLLSNLAGNAVTHGSANRPIHVTAKIVDNALVLSVTNFGQPIPEAVLSGLFEPFSRGGDENSMQGLGLGLYISDQIAKAHDGTLRATSDPAQTRFQFEMPIQPTP